MNNASSTTTTLARPDAPCATSDSVLPGHSEEVLLTPMLSENAVMSEVPAEPRRMQPLQFACGVLVTTAGMGLILLVGIKMLEVRQIAGDFALGLVAIGVLTGVTLLGGGFGLMATASGGFDEREFDQLMKAGNISSVDSTKLTSATPQSSHPKSAA